MFDVLGGAKPVVRTSRCRLGRRPFGEARRLDPETVRDRDVRYENNLRTLRCGCLGVAFHRCIHSVECRIPRGSSPRLPGRHDAGTTFIDLRWDTPSVRSISGIHAVIPGGHGGIPRLGASLPNRRHPRLLMGGHPDIGRAELAVGCRRVPGLASPRDCRTGASSPIPATTVLEWIVHRRRLEGGRIDLCACF